MCMVDYFCNQGHLIVPWTCCCHRELFPRVNPEKIVFPPFSTVNIHCWVSCTYLVFLSMYHVYKLWGLLSILTWGLYSALTYYTILCCCFLYMACFYHYFFLVFLSCTLILLSTHWSWVFCAGSGLWSLHPPVRHFCPSSPPGTGSDSSLGGIFGCGGSHLNHGA